MAASDDKPENDFDLSTHGGFERFVLTCQARLQRFLLRKGVLAEDAKQLCQDAFLTLWQNRHKARRPETFVMGIGNRFAMAYHRKRVRLQSVSIEDVPAEVRAAPAAEGGLVENPMGESAVTAALVARLERLPPRQREVIELVWLQRSSRRDAARTLGISEGALRFHEKQALDRLREEGMNHGLRG